MLKLEDLKEGARIRGLHGEDFVHVVQVEPVGEHARKVYYIDNQGQSGEQILSRSDEFRLQLHSSSQTLLDQNEGRSKCKPRVWYVMQGKTFNPSQGQQYLWAPQQGKSGRSFAHWHAVSEVQPSDIVVHHAAGGIKALSRAISAPRVEPQPNGANDSWQGEGYRVDIQKLVDLDPPIDLDLVRDKSPRLQQALNGVRGPYNRMGSGNQGYLFEFTWEALAILLEDVPAILPEELRQWLPEIDKTVTASLPSRATNVPARSWLPQVQAYMAAQGFYYSVAEIANFYLSLRTKPLVLLAGVSGTGKTQLVRQFASAIGYGDADHCELIAVRPDWADSSDLIGYTNIQGEFVSQPLLEVMMRAIAHPDDLYFVILDEMNLARVEHYFAEFLSYIETRQRDERDMIVTAPWITRPDVNDGQPVYIPQNLFVVGTVNMDETTHPFSRKVLDRANAIEMNDIDLSWAKLPEQAEQVSGIFADALAAPFLSSKDLTQEQQVTLDKTLTLLKKINYILEPAGLHFGYRVRDEIAFYLTLHLQEQLSALDGFSTDAALDFQLMQKVLPRIQGSSTAVLKVLIQLLGLLSEQKLPNDAEYSEIVNAIKIEGSRLPRSIRKLLFMLQRFNEDGFTSYWL